MLAFLPIHFYLIEEKSIKRSLDIHVLIGIDFLESPLSSKLFSDIHL